MHDHPANMTIDRRRHPRLNAVRPAKVFLPEALRFAPAQTTDISQSGALLCVDRARTLAPGDMIEVLVPPPGAAMAEAKNMTPARVVRVTPVDHFQQAVAVEYASMAKAKAA